MNRRPASSIQQIAKNMRSGLKAVYAAEPEEGQVADLPYNTQIYTYFTVVGNSDLLFTAPGWVTVKLTLETAGPVAVSTSQDVQPVLSGRGALLPPGVEIAFTLPKGNRLYVGSAAVNRVKVVVEPLPWLQSLAISIDRNTKSIVRSVQNAVNAFRPNKAAVVEKPEVPCPPPHRPFFPKGRR